MAGVAGPVGVWWALDGGAADLRAGEAVPVLAGLVADAVGAVPVGVRGALGCRGCGGNAGDAVPVLAGHCAETVVAVPVGVGRALRWLRLRWLWLG